MNAWMVIAVTLGSVYGLAPVVAAQTADKALNVYVVASLESFKGVDDEAHDRLKQAANAATSRRKAVEKQLKAEHGNKPDTWPQDKQYLLLDAQDAEALAKADFAYSAVKSEPLADTAEDIRRALAGAGGAGTKENVVVVESPAEAHLIVEVVARRSEEGRGTPLIRVALGDSFWVSFLIKAGPKLNSGRLRTVPRTYEFRRLGRSAWRLQTPGPETPYWRFDAYSQTRWYNAASTASLVIEDFIAKHYDTLSGPAI